MPITIDDALGTPDFWVGVIELIAASQTLNIDFFGVGALARNIWYTEHNLPARGTRDVDFGVCIPNQQTYLSLKSELLQHHGYIQSSENTFCLISPRGIPVDLLPFGEIEYEDSVIIDAKGLFYARFDGLKEVYLHGLQKVDLEGDIIYVCTITAVVLLKLIAFDDRPEHRAKDPFDVASILEVYPNIEADLIWEAYNFLYDQPLTHKEIGTMVMGCEMRKLVGSNTKLYKRVTDILQRGIAQRTRLAQRMIIDPSKDTITANVKKLQLLKAGFKLGV
ncbi:MAG: hypothetical protein AAF828_05480 [Bacteroidota bacterium]